MSKPRGFDLMFDETPGLNKGCTVSCRGETFIKDGEIIPVVEMSAYDKAVEELKKSHQSDLNLRKLLNRIIKTGYLRGPTVHLVVDTEHDLIFQNLETMEILKDLGELEE